MGTFSTTKDVIGLLDADVLLGGGRFDALRCLSISKDAGLGGTKAEFELPSYLFDSYRDNITNSTVSVRVRNTYDSGGSATDFVGFFDVDNASLEDETVTLSASSMGSFLGRVGIGDGDDIPVLMYPLLSPYDGQPTIWTPARILRDLFNRLPNKYKNNIKLGNTRVIDTTQMSNTPELVFRHQTYTAAIDQILALFGDVSIIERFSGSTCYLDFFRMNDSSNGRCYAQIGRWGDPISDGVEVGSLSHNQTTADAITRVKVYGTKRRYVISVLSYDPDPEKQLIKGWDPLLEAAVIADPKRATPGAPGYQIGMELVGKRWYLPASLRPYTKLKDLGVTRLPVGGQPGPTYPVQVWKLPTVLAVQEDGSVIGTESMTAAMLRNAKLELDKGYIELGSTEDGLNILKLENGTNNQGIKTTWSLAKMGITLCVEGEDWLVADTGPDYSSGIRYDFSSDGLFERINREDLTFLQFTNIGYPFKSPTGAPMEFGCYFFNEDTRTWVNQDTPLVSRDDSAKARTIAREVLRAKNQKHHTYTAVIPYFTRSFTHGSRLIVRGQNNFRDEGHAITSVTWDLVENTTTVMADNVRPPKRNKTKQRRNSGGKGGFYKAGLDAVEGPE